MSWTTRLQEFMIERNNPIVVFQHSVLTVFAFVISAFPSLTEVHKSILDLDIEVDRASAIRKQQARERIKQLEEIEKDTAEHKAQMAKDKADIIKQKEASLRDKRVTESQTKSDVKVIHEQGKGKLEVVKAGEMQQVELAHQDTRDTLEQQKTTHKKTHFIHLQTHLDTMTQLTKAMETASDTAKAKAGLNEAATRASMQSIMKLETAMGKVKAANLALQKALDSYETTVAKGDMDIDKENAISKALITSLRAERSLETHIETTDIQHKSTLRQALMEDVAAKNIALDDTLHKYSKQTLEKLSELIQAEISEDQEKISGFTDPADIEECQSHLETLATMLDQVNKISLAKPDEDTHTASFN
ncbi:MAG: hypothetical protein KBB94_08120 [Legionellaceae bacterium]|nr:hypothetical protein [Legionellaceae bacterium]MBP9775595.1 hypothetical protein [Legionellaceae bacterium]